MDASDIVPRGMELKAKLRAELASYNANDVTVRATMLVAEKMLGFGYEEDEVESILMTLLIDIVDQGETRGGLEQMFSSIGDMFKDISKAIGEGNLYEMEKAVGDEEETKPSLPRGARASERRVQRNGRQSDRGRRPPPPGRRGRRKS